MQKIYCTKTNACHFLIGKGLKWPRNAGKAFVLAAKKFSAHVLASSKKKISDEFNLRSDYWRSFYQHILLTPTLPTYFGLYSK